MKIAFLVSRFPVLSEAFIVNQITGLLDRGHQVDIYALSGFSGEPTVHPDIERYDLRSNVTYVPRLPDSFGVRTLSGIPVGLRTATGDLKLFLSALNVAHYGKAAASLRLLHLASAFVDRPSYDIIHCQFGTCGLLGLALRDMGAIAGKLVTTFRGFDISEYPRRHGAAVYQPLFKQGDLFLTNCEFFRQRVIDLGGAADKVWVHGSSIDCERFGLAASTLSAAQIEQGDTVRLLTVGRLTEKKGIEYGIRAVARLVSAGFQVRYHIVGEGPLRAELTQLIRAVGLENCVYLLGSQPQPAIVAQLRQAHIFLAPCVTAQNGDQDAPVNTLKEAMATGLPVVSTWHGGIPELVEDGVSGYLVPERDAAAIADKVADLIAYPERWSPMGLAGRRKVLANYEINHLSDELVRHYQQLLQGSPAAPEAVPLVQQRDRVMLS
ncbi:MAG: glycosyltransferase [Cyanobacteria bacterium J06648_16]